MMHPQEVVMSDHSIPELSLKEMASSRHIPKRTVLRTTLLFFLIGLFASAAVFFFTRDNGHDAADGMISEQEQLIRAQSGLGIIPDISGYDFSRHEYRLAIELLETHLNASIRYLRELEINAPSFFSADAGSGFAQIAHSLSALRDFDLQWLSAVIEQNNIVRDVDRMILLYRHQKDALHEELTAVQRNIENLITLSEAHSGAGGAAYDAIYTAMLEQTTAALAMQTQMNALNNRLAALTQADEPNEELIARVERDFAALAGLIERELNTAVSAVREYYNINFPDTDTAPPVWIKLLKILLAVTAAGLIIGILRAYGRKWFS
jgi:hypothetical protein